MRKSSKTLSILTKIFFVVYLVYVLYQRQQGVLEDTDSLLTVFFASVLHIVVFTE